MANTFRCSVVTPSSVCLNEEATYVSFQAFDGQKGVLPGASPFLTRLGPGLFTLNAAAGNKTLVIAGGFAQMQGDVLTLLADSAVDAATIDPKQASDELQKATANAVSGGGTSPEQRDAIELAQQIAYAKVAATRGR
jgi:F-type H+-transporting ATPase subunit epsilon